jgi:hypothetical protein
VTSGQPLPATTQEGVTSEKNNNTTSCTLSPLTKIIWQSTYLIEIEVCHSQRLQSPKKEGMGTKMKKGETAMCIL